MQIRIEKSNNFTVINKVPLTSDCIDESIVNGVREHLLYCFAVVKRAGHKIYEKPRVKLFQKINETVLSQITF